VIEDGRLETVFDERPARCPVEISPSAGLPPNPGAWITTAARNKAIDRLRRESRHDRHAESVLLHERNEPLESVTPVNDDRLCLTFTCCHPALATSTQVALTLRLLGGLGTDEIAHAVLVAEPTMAQRLVRAERKIRDAGIPYRIPADGELPNRLRSVPAVAYRIVNEGYPATGGDALVREDLCTAAIRLSRLLTDLLPDEPEALGSPALLLLTEALRAARTGDDGSLCCSATNIDRDGTGPSSSRPMRPNDGSSSKARRLTFVTVRTGPRT
jgi:RNA polymerase sigma-70 factor (ECF subfamily)